MPRYVKVLLAIVAISGMVAALFAALLAAVSRIAPPARPPGALTIVAPAPGLGAIDVDVQVCARILEAIVPLSRGDVWTEAHEGECTLHAWLDAAEPEATMARAREALATLALPEPPTLRRTSGAPIDVYVAVETSGTIASASLLADRVLRPRIERIPGVGAVEVCGMESIVEVRVDPTALAASGVSLAAIERALRAPSDSVPAGRVGAVELRVGADSHASVAALGDLPLAADGTTRLALRDLATIADAVRPRRCTAYREGEAIAALRVSLDPPLAGEAQGRIAEELAAAGLPPDVRALAITDAVYVWRARAASSDPEMTDRFARALSRSSGAPIVLADTAASELAVAVSPLAEDAIEIRIGEIPGLALLSTPRALARVWVRGPDREVLEPIVARARAALEALGACAAPLAAPPRPMLDVRVDRERAAAYGVLPEDVARVIALAHGLEVSVLALDDRTLPVVLRLDVDAADPSAIHGLALGRVRVGEVSTIELGLAPAALHRSGGDPAIGLLVSSTRAALTLDDVQDAIVRIELPPGVVVVLTPP